MLYAEMQNNNLICRSADNPLNSKDTFGFEDEDFTYLFDFAAIGDEKISAIDSALTRYIYMILDENTLHLRSDIDKIMCEKYVETIDDWLVQIHPFFGTYDHDSALPYILTQRMNLLLYNKELSSMDIDGINIGSITKLVGFWVPDIIPPTHI